jgi:hypothetical protein
VVRHHQGSSHAAPPDYRVVADEKFDTSGKSPAYVQHRKKFYARAGKPAAGFFESGGGRIS